MNGEQVVITVTMAGWWFDTVMCGTIALGTVGAFFMILSWCRDEA